MTTLVDRLDDKLLLCADAFKNSLVLYANGSAQEAIPWLVRCMSEVRAVLAKSLPMTRALIDGKYAAPAERWHELSGRALDLYAAQAKLLIKITET
jgi:hypothetical protein